MHFIFPCLSCRSLSSSWTFICPCLLYYHKPLFLPVSSLFLPLKTNSVDKSGLEISQEEERQTEHVVLCKCEKRVWDLLWWYPRSTSSPQSCWFNVHRFLFCESDKSDKSSPLSNLSVERNNSTTIINVDIFHRTYSIVSFLLLTQRETHMLFGLLWLSLFSGLNQCKLAKYNSLFVIDKGGHCFCCHTRSLENCYMHLYNCRYK